MTLDDTLGRLQDAAWEHVSSLPDNGALTNEQLAGWAQVARAAGPLLTALDRTDLMQSIQRTATAIPARPAARATPDSTLMALAGALREVQDQLPPDETSRENTRDVVALVIQSTARTTAAAARDSRNPQVQNLSTDLDAAAVEAHTAVQDPQARAVPMAEGAPARSQERVVDAQAQQRAHERRQAMSSTQDGPSQARGRRM